MWIWHFFKRLLIHVLSKTIERALHLQTTNFDCVTTTNTFAKKFREIDFFKRNESKIYDIFTLCVCLPTYPYLEAFLSSWHSVEISAFFCHSDFTWNQICDPGISKKCHFLPFWRILILIFFLVNFSLEKCKYS